MNKKQSEKLEAIVNSYWDSLPEEMQNELRNFYEEVNDAKAY